MKPLIAVVLCCSFLSSGANPLPLEFLDCDDPDVFKAVDAALKKYNGERATGNQFALYMVMEAKRTAGPDTQFYVKYRIRETTCAIEENKLWQDCDYKVPAEAGTGECTAQVHVNGADKTSNVSQDCKIFPATPKIKVTEAICTGCFQPISRDSLKVSDILKQTIQKFNQHSAETALYKLVEIKEAQIQVVAGFNYVIKYEIEETNCSKDQFQDLTPECKPTSRGRVGKCEAKAYESLHGQIVDTAHQCKLPVEETISATRTGCPKSIPRDSPELKELLKASMEKYNSESNDDFYYKGGEIQAATVQVVAGQNYHLTFTVQKTNCSKKEFEKFPEDCEATSDSVPLPCEAQIHVIPWDNKILPQVNCSKGRSMEVLMRRPPGFTPFRSATLRDQPAGISCSDKNEEEKERPGEEPRKDGGQEPEGEDRAGSPLPRCPGKPWKQITDLPAASTFPREFTNEDLLPSAAESTDPATDGSTPPQNEEKDLDLSDALP
ncbi:PREDICTED: kininogen-1 isoform X2 [Calidris pugnax]|uniref:kininogen-1 isoform X2 n=1 Tax=Calidris pugnax TaxID=198806 RepID=UPI00071E2F32|nr:PREDICTED: kininogen-1 isoform X2 [Calidris pugnax]